MRALRCFFFVLWISGLAGRLHAASPPAPTTVKADPFSATRVVISVPDQLLALVQERAAVVYPISTSKFGLGDGWGSYKTPLGRFRICEKLGEKLRLGSVIKGRYATGEVLAPNAPGRDPIVTRILWLQGLEPGNIHAHDRSIYIHGTPEESRLGQPVSWGCVRMRSLDVVNVFDRCPLGSDVLIGNAHLGALLQKELGDGLAECPALPGFPARVPVPITPERPFLAKEPDPVPRPWLRFTLGSDRSVALAAAGTGSPDAGSVRLERPSQREVRAARLEAQLLARDSLRELPVPAPAEPMIAISR